MKPTVQIEIKEYLRRLFFHAKFDREHWPEIITSMLGSNYKVEKKEYEKLAPLSKINEWKDSELVNTYEKMKAEYDRMEELEKQIGELPEEVHPDERKPRAETWLKERMNWQKEVESLRNTIDEQELIILGLEEGSGQWKAAYENETAPYLNLLRRALDFLIEVPEGQEDIQLKSDIEKAMPEWNEPKLHDLTDPLPF